MTSDEIATAKASAVNELDTTRWLKEIAYQLARMNEIQGRYVGSDEEFK